MATSGERQDMKILDQRRAPIHKRGQIVCSAIRVTKERTDAGVS